MYYGGGRSTSDIDVGAAKRAIQRQQIASAAKARPVMPTVPQQPPLNSLRTVLFLKAHLSFAIIGVVEKSEKEVRRMTEVWKVLKNL